MSFTVQQSSPDIPAQLGWLGQLLYRVGAAHLCCGAASAAAAVLAVLLGCQQGRLLLVMLLALAAGPCLAAAGCCCLLLALSAWDQETATRWPEYARAQ